jgi:hypothetical protein
LKDSAVTSARNGVNVKRLNLWPLIGDDGSNFAGLNVTKENRTDLVPRCEVLNARPDTRRI